MNPPTTALHLNTSDVNEFKVVMTQKMLGSLQPDAVIRLRVALLLTINRLTQLGLDRLYQGQCRTLFLSHTRARTHTCTQGNTHTQTHTAFALHVPPHLTPVCILPELLASLMGKEGTGWTGREETVGMRHNNGRK